MNKTWFTADHHFGHKNIIEYTNRPFETAKEMDNELIKRWNDRVSPGDIVYYLGDFTLGNNARQYMEQLNGLVRFVYGGHDYHWWPKEEGKIIWYDLYHCRFLEPLTTVEFPDLMLDNKYPLPVILCHYPLLSWDRSHYGSWHLHGHTHGTIGETGNSGDKQLPPKSSGGRNGKRLDVGVDCHDYYPISLEEVQELLT